MTREDRSKGFLAAFDFSVGDWDLRRAAGRPLRAGSAEKRSASGPITGCFRFAAARRVQRKCV